MPGGKGQGHVKLIEKMWRPVVDYALPPRCPGCGTIIPDQGVFCIACWSSLHFLTPPYCAGCGIPFAVDRGEGALCGACLRETPRHDGVRAAVRYDDISRDVAMGLKYGGRIWLARLIARQMLRNLPAEASSFLVVPVPLHWTRLWRRGFNQSALVAQQLARMGGDRFSYECDLLHRTRMTPPLRNMSARKRSELVKGAFSVRPRFMQKLSGASVILVDDIYTSGSTSGACVSALKRAGAGWVQVHCWARVLAEVEI